MLNQIRIVLIETSHPGNIGAVARAMKNMALEQLCLVGPKNFPSDEAYRRSSGAHDILSKPKIYNNLDEAISDCIWIVGASARSRNLVWPVCSPRQLMPEISKQAAKGPVAILFGRENSGLSNAELQRCHRHVHIPSNPAYSSLNLAMAVQVTCYELYQEFMARPEALNDPAKNNAAFGQQQDAVLSPGDEGWDEPPATTGEMERFFVHLEEMLVDIDFHDPAKPRQLMPRLRRLFQRVQPGKIEMNILRGILKSAQVAAGSLHPDKKNSLRVKSVAAKQQDSSS